MCIDDVPPSCGLRKKTWQRDGCSSGSIVGDWARDPVDDKYRLVSCPVGHVLRNATLEVQKCEKCAEGKYIVDSMNPRDTDGSLAVCKKCPNSAVCPGGGPPLFGTQAVESSLTLPDFPPGSGDPKELALQALAELLGIDTSLIVLSDIARRATTVAFRIYGSPEEISRVTSALADPSSLATGLSAVLSASYNVTVMPVVDAPKPVQDRTRTPIGEVWEEVGGQYVLRSCGEGSLLVNNSLDDQQCMPCKPMSYTLSATFGCAATECFPRECRKCPK
jgi:hypothetical protein